eukprot:gene36671-44487_t
MSASMLAMIQTYWDSMKAQIEDESAGKSSANITLEEISPLIPAFLKRFRSVYEQVESKHVASEPDADNLSSGLSKVLQKGKPALNPNSVEAMDIANQTKTTLPAVLEFVLDCYCLQWQSILKNGNDSMLTVMFKASNKKKFSQRTNDMKSKAIIDFLSSASAADVPELLLFNHLVGLLPKPTSKISPAWGNIVTSIFVMAYCDKSLKQGVIHDSGGEPSVTELRNKLYKSYQMQYQKTLSIKKCIKILKLFISSRHMYWNMSPLSSACIEYSTSLPWSKQSLSKLMNVLLFVASFDASQRKQEVANNVVRFNVSVDVESGANIARSGLNSPSMSHRPSISTVNVSVGDKSTPASSLNKPSSPSHSHRPSVVSAMTMPTTAPSTASNTGAVASKPGTGKRGSMSSSSEQANFLSSFLTSFNQGGAMSPGGSTFSPSPMHPGKRNIATKVDLLKCLDTVIDRVWNTHVAYHAKLEGRPDEDDEEDDYHMLYSPDEVLQKISTFDNIVDSEACYVDLDFESCQKVGNNTLINLVDFAFLMMRCWEAEHFHIKLALSKGSLTVQRRAAIVGFYDPNQAVLTAAEKLCIVRLLHYYSINKEFRGVDWDEVLQAGSSGYANGKAVKFPFTLPESLLSKSHNELNYLVDKVTKMLMQQRELDELEDIKTRGRVLVSSYANQQPDYTSDLTKMIEEVTFDPKTEEITVEEEATPAESTTGTPTGKEVRRHLQKKKKALSLQLTTGEMQDIMKSSGLLSPQALHKPTRAGSEMLSVEQVKAYHAEVELKMREHAQEHGHVITANVNERVVPKRLQSPSALQIARHNLEKNRVHVDAINKPVGSGRKENVADKSLAPHMVDIMDNDGDVLNNSNVMSLSRPLSGKHLHQERHRGNKE